MNYIILKVLESTDIPIKQKISERKKIFFCIGCYDTCILKHNYNPKINLKNSDMNALNVYVI